MEIYILLTGLAFLGIAGALIFFIMQETPHKQPIAGPSAVVREIDPVPQYQKKLAANEEKLKNLQMSVEATQFELKNSKEKEKALLKEKSENAFNADQYEKFKKDFAQLKIELTKKEEMLEKEITEKRKHSQELLVLEQDNVVFKKRVTEAEDAHRKAQTTIEVLTKERDAAKKIIDEQKRIVDEHAQNKVGGEWVSRAEFDAIEQELKEKETMIQKLLSLKKGE